MKLESVGESGFREYGQIVEGYDFTLLLKTLKEKTPRPLDQSVYVPGDPALENLPVYKELRDNYYGGLPIQIGYTNGFSTLLNGIEYHRSSEILIVADDVILFLAKQWEIDPLSWNIDVSKVRAFFVSAGTALEIYATTLHYSPAAVDERGYQTAVVLPKGTNLEKPVIKEKNAQDRYMTAANKWLLVHQDAKHEIENGALIGIRGENPDSRQFWKKR
ncbi:DUF4867 domain-containing protein [Spirochaetia bacterium]|nr:DUF4867 domain-containing protein [Spirochaetia bacterium]